MVYPTLPADADAVSIYEQGLSPYYDITWSVTYRVDNLPPDNEIGLCMFLQDQTQPLSGGGVGIDLGYSGLSADNPSYPTSVGMLSAVIGIGLDSTGQFPLSVQWPDGTIRDGLSETERVFNSASIRGSYPNYPYLSGSNTEITDFDIVDAQKKTIRARLGNYGRTIYLDYKRNDDDSFTNILTKDVYIPFNETTRFRPGVSITKPISSNISPVSQVIVEAFHVEGLDKNPTNAEFQFNPLTIYSQNTSINTTPPAVCPEVLPPLPPLPPPVCPRPLVQFQKVCGDTLSGANSDTDITTAVYRISGGTGPVTITYNLSSPPLSSINTTLSTTSYEFETGVSQLSVNILSGYFNDFSLWSISEGSMVTFSNLNSAVSGEVLTVVGFNGYPDICTLWVDESAADGLSISASYCQEYLSAFTMVLTGDYSFAGAPVGQQASPSNNELYKVVNRLDKPTPVRFDVEYDDQSIYDTGFVGSEEYSYGGIYRQNFIDAIDSGTAAVGLSASQIAQDGYPFVIPTLSSSTIYQKESDSVRAQVTVYDILSSRDWTFSMSCPCFELYPFTINWCTSAWTTGPGLCPNPGFWSVNNNGTRIRFNIADSENCGGTCDKTQHGSASATITTGSFPVDMNLVIKGVGEQQDVDYEQIYFRLNGVLIAEGASTVEDMGCVMGPIITSYIIQPPYRLEANRKHSLVIDFTTADELYHLDAYYEVDLSFEPVNNDDLRHWQRIDCDVASQLSAVGDGCVQPPDPDPDDDGDGGGGGDPPVSPCDPDHTELCWTLDGVELAVLNGSTNAGLFAGIWDNFGEDTPVTLTWDAVQEAWILDTNDGVYVDEIISVDRCDPSGGVNVSLGRFRITIGACGTPCDPEITEVCVTITPHGGVAGSDTLTGNLTVGFYGDSGIDLIWNLDEEVWEIVGGLAPSIGGSFRRCNPAGSGYLSDPLDAPWTAVVTLGPC